MQTTPCQHLTHTFTRLSHLSHLSAIASWDMFAMMLPGGSPALAEPGVLQHQILTDKQVGHWLAAAEQDDLTNIERANLREMQRQYQQAVLLPTALVEAKILAGSRCEQAWRTQRPNNDWASFSPNLSEVVTLSHEEARLRAAAHGGSPYDALLDIYEPGMTSARLNVLFGDLKHWLPTLLAEVVERQQAQSLTAPVGPFPVAAQHEPGLDAMALLGFDFNAGRLNISAHPFRKLYFHALRRQRTVQRAVRRDPRNRARALRAKPAAPVVKPADSAGALHRAARIPEPVL